MNTLCVTLSIPLLLILAGFNANAHGLTTFGKSQNNQQNQPAPGTITKACENQQVCSYIKNTTCITGFCKCGDNQFPINGECRAKLQGPNHICTKSDDCVEFADCISVRELAIQTQVNLKIFTADMSICKCQEGYEEYQGVCGGGTKNYATLPLILVWLTTYLTAN